MCLKLLFLTSVACISKKLYYLLSQPQFFYPTICYTGISCLKFVMFSISVYGTHIEGFLTFYVFLHFRYTV